MGVRSCCSAGCWCFWTFLKWFVLVTICSHFGTNSVWDWAWDPQTTCQAPALPANQSGLKVLIYGPQKTGTKSMTKGLLKAGLPMTYHSEEFLFNVWTGIADAFWARPENGRAKMATTWPPANKGGVWATTDSDLKVLQGTSPEDLAAAISRCRVDAMAFDSIENTFWPILNVSRGVKVISLNWRTWEQWNKSTSEFDGQLALAIYLYGLLLAPMHLLPWSVVVIPILEFFSDNAIHKFLSTGGPPFTAVGSIPVVWFRYQACGRRWVTHLGGGLCHKPADSEEYYGGFEAIRKAVPAGDLLEWDMKKHTMADLCAFLGSDEPGCREPGPLPKGINIMYIEREQWPITLTLVPVFLVLQWIAWRLAHIVCGAAMHVLTWPCRTPFGRGGGRRAKAE